MHDDTHPVRRRPPPRTRTAGAALLALAAAAAWATPTEITVRVISKGAKFVGTSMGGALVTLRDADTGELLARGVTAGSTGDTARIMETPQRRGATLSSAGAAKFTAVLDLHAPRRIEVRAYGPLAQRQAAASVTSTQWVIPGRHLTGGDGWLLELPGFVVDVLEPAAHSGFERAPVTVPVIANVTLMCGCPITPGGLWDADAYEVRAVVTRDGAPYAEQPLTYAGTASRFRAELTIDAPGTYEVVVYAYDPANGNTGLDRTTFRIGG